MLTLDLGNSSASVACVKGPGAELMLACAAGELDAAMLEGCLDRAGAAGERPELAAISAVGAVDEERRVRGLLEGLGLAVAVNPDAGLELRLERPETCGRDRLYGARGALEALAGGPPPDGLVVVDSGTALTVDAVAITASGGAFLGGAIAPGPGTLAASLSGAGARLPEFSARPDVAALGRSTEGALRSGVAVGFRGAVEALTRAIAEEAFGPTARVAGFLTGGARRFALEGVSSGLGAAPTVVELLVHQGLAAATRESR